MNIIAVIEVDLKKNHLGLTNYCLERVGDKRIIEYVIERLRKVPRIDTVVIACSKEEDARVLKEVLGETSCDIITHDVPDLPYRDILRRARKWSINSWRGGIGFTSVMDEWGNANLMRKLMDEYEADAVVKASASQLFLDVELLDCMIDWHYDYRPNILFTFSGCAPGFACEIYTKEMLTMLAQANASVRNGLKYEPGKVQPDPAIGESNYKAEELLRLFPLRTSVDTKRSLTRARKIYEHSRADFAALDASAMVKICHENAEIWVDEMPAEVEIEITTEFNAKLVLNPPKIYNRAPVRISMDEFSKIVDNLNAYDDINLTFGGFGEPLLHPELVQMVKLAKEKGGFGIHIATDGSLLKGRLAKELATSDVDVISIALNANEPKTYQRMWGEDRFLQVVENITAFIEMRNDLGKGYPFIIPEIVKSKRTFPEIEAFFDYWYEKADWVTIRPFNDYAGQIADRSVIHMGVAKRIPCQKIFNKLTIWADGDIVVCGQDFSKKKVLANVKADSIADVWNHPFLSQMRKHHFDEKYSDFELCSQCYEWYYV